MKRKVVISLALIVASMNASDICHAQEAEGAVPAATQPTASTPEQTPDKPKLVSIIPTLPDYTGDLKSRKYLTGDWNGERTRLAEKGILFQFELDQFLQGNVHGGRDTNNAARYFGAWDMRLKLDTARMGLWSGGLFEIMAESQFGDSVNDEVGGVANDYALFPIPDYRDVTMSQFSYTQALSEHFGFILGKLDITGGDKNEFASIQGNNFIHAAFGWNPVTARTVPYSPLGAGVFVLGDWGIWNFNILDTEGAPNVSGFDTVFHGGTTVASEVRFNVKPFELPGHQLFGGTWSDKNFVSLEQDPRLGLPNYPLLSLALTALGLNRESSSWCFYYNFDQYFYVEPEDENQGVGLFGRFGLSDGEANAVETFYSIGVGGTGLIPKRDHDKFGVGYFYTGYSGDLQEIVSLDDSQGVELFYRIEVTPWFYLTPDLQFIVNPGGSSDADVAIVYGLRGQVSF